MDKNKRIEQEIKELSKLLEEVEGKQKKLAKRLIERAAFMKITLEDLEKDINENGSSYKMEQGKQKLIVENPSQKTYNTLINRYATVYKQIIDLQIKTNCERDVDDGFESFVNSRTD